MNGAPRIAPIPMSSPAVCPDRSATIGSSVSGNAVPTAARTDPTTPSERPNASPIHSTPFVNSSAPPRITRSERERTTQSMFGGFSHPAAAPWRVGLSGRSTPRELVLPGLVPDRPALHGLHVELVLE